MTTISDLNPDEILDIEHAIRKAEGYTSAEIRVYIENKSVGVEPTLRAKSVFLELGMDNTNFDNAVLFYVCLGLTEFAILGAEKLEDKLPLHFWNEIELALAKRFRNHKIIIGLYDAILETGIRLAPYFPYNEKGDLNELSNEVVLNDN
jgi:uncharacterized membrane protein